MNRNNLAFGKMNYILCGVSIFFIVLGFILMTGSATTFDHFEPDIFSTRRIVVAPMTCFFGFLLMIVAILYPVKKEAVIESDSNNEPQTSAAQPKKK